ncbi:hypothetical protein MKEN_00323400 [Mycena kentingensis (nom. inval.)]|nr:hypothetical protein MKEN_00323400 [Mycena kentingensis (nom. inval.)]
MLFSSLPLELVHEIINVVQDPTTLSSCSLVSSAWLPSARASRWRTLILNKRGSSKTTYARFYAAPHLFPYVRSLKLSCERSSWISWDDELQHLVPLIQNLRNAEHVELTGVDLVWQPEPVLCALDALLHAPTTRYVVLRRCLVPAHVLTFFGAKLRDLELLDVDIDSEASVCGFAISAKPRRVVIQGSNIEQVVDWLAPKLLEDSLFELLRTTSRLSNTFWVL